MLSRRGGRPGIGGGFDIGSLSVVGNFDRLSKLSKPRVGSFDSWRPGPHPRRHLGLRAQRQLGSRFVTLQNGCEQAGEFEGTCKQSVVFFLKVSHRSKT